MADTMQMIETPIDDTAEDKNDEDWLTYGTY